MNLLDMNVVCALSIGAILIGVVSIVVFRRFTRKHDITQGKGSCVVTIILLVGLVLTGIYIFNSVGRPVPSQGNTSGLVQEPSDSLGQAILQCLRQNGPLGNQVFNQRVQYASSGRIEYRYAFACETEPGKFGFAAWSTDGKFLGAESFNLSSSTEAVELGQSAIIGTVQEPGYSIKPMVLV